MFYNRPSSVTDGSWYMFLFEATDIDMDAWWFTSVFLDFSALCVLISNFRDSFCSDRVDISVVVVQSIRNLGTIQISRLQAGTSRKRYSKIDH